MNPDTKQAAFKEITALLSENTFDAIVLARFMQILPDTLAEQHYGKIINIHHSFLPAFLGAGAYQQAHDRGVKLVGATSHYVTDKLDEGPIIDQGVTRIAHHHSVDDIARLTRDIEKQVLSRALHAHLQDRIVIHNHKTIVFE